MFITDQRSIRDSGKSALIISELPYARNLANWFSGKSLKLLPPDVRY